MTAILKWNTTIRNVDRSIDRIKKITWEKKNYSNSIDEQRYQRYKTQDGPLRDSSIIVKLIITIMLPPKTFTLKHTFKNMCNICNSRYILLLYYEGNKNASKLTSTAVKTESRRYTVAGRKELRTIHKYLTVPVLGMSADLLDCLIQGIWHHWEGSSGGYWTFCFAKVKRSLQLFIHL